MDTETGRVRYADVLLKYRLEFYGKRLPTRVLCKRSQTLIRRLKYIAAKSALLLGDICIIETDVEKTLIVEHGWHRIGASIVRPEIAQKHLLAFRALQINQRLICKLDVFSLMSTQYRNAVARGVMTGIRPLP